MSAGRIAGRARVVLGMDDSTLNKGIKNAQAKMRAFSDSLGAIGKDLMAGGASIIAPLAAITSKFMSIGDNLDKMSLRTRMSVESLSTLAHVAQQSGSDLEAVEKAVHQMRYQLSSAPKEFEKLGISIKDFQKLSADQQFQKMADTLNAISDPLKRSSAALDMFGKRLGSNILAVIENMNSLSGESRRYGLITTYDAKVAADLADALGRLKTIASTLAVAIGSALTPSLIDSGRSLEDVALSTREWLRDNKETINIALRTAVAIGGIGAAFFAVSTAIKGASFALGAFKIASVAIIGLSNGVILLGSGIAQIVPPLVGIIANITALDIAAAASSISMAGLATSITAVGLAALKFIALPIGVAIAGWKIGEAISEWTGLAKAIENAYNWWANFQEPTDSNARSKMIEEWNRQLQDGTITLEEYQKRVESINRILDKKPSLSKAAGDTPDTQDTTETDKQKNELMRIRNENERLFIQSRYEGIEQERQLLALERQKNIEAADGNAEIIRAIEAQFSLKSELLNQKESELLLDEMIAAIDKESAAAMERANVMRQREATYSEIAYENARLQLETKYEGVELEKKLLELEKQRAIAGAKFDSGTIDEKQKALLEEQYALREKLIDGRKVVERQQSTAMGTFSAENISRMFGTGQSEQKRTATAVEKMEKSTTELVRFLKSTPKLVFAE